MFGWGRNKFVSFTINLYLIYLHLFFSPALLLSTLTPLFLPSSSVSLFVFHSCHSRARVFGKTLVFTNVNHSSDFTLFTQISYSRTEWYSFFYYKLASHCLHWIFEFTPTNAKISEILNWVLDMKASCTLCGEMKCSSTASERANVPGGRWAQNINESVGTSLFIFALLQFLLSLFLSSYCGYTQPLWKHSSTNSTFPNFYLRCLKVVKIFVNKCYYTEIYNN